jgi:hypothetical protein
MIHTVKLSSVEEVRVRRIGVYILRQTRNANKIS